MNCNSFCWPSDYNQARVRLIGNYHDKGYELYWSSDPIIWYICHISLLVISQVDKVTILKMLANPLHLFHNLSHQLFQVQVRFAISFGTKLFAIFISGPASWIPSGSCCLKWARTAALCGTTTSLALPLVECTQCTIKLSTRSGFTIYLLRTLYFHLLVSRNTCLASFMLGILSELGNNFPKSVPLMAHFPKRGHINPF